MLKHVIKYTLFILLWTLTCTSFAKDDTAKPTILQVIEKTITVNGKKSKVFDVVQPDGTFGYVGTKGQVFNVTVLNKTHVPTVLHWHGIIDPNSQDGVPYVTQLPILPGKTYHYQFKLKQAGTFWLHSHYKLQEQKLMAAPLIIHDPNTPHEKEVVMFVQDFTFENPVLIYEKLRHALQAQSSKQSSKQSSFASTNKKLRAHAKKTSMADVNDVKFDAYLTNHRTLRDPDVIRVQPKQTVLLRIIDASSSSAYYVDLGKLTGTLVAVDARPVKPVRGSRFQMAIGNRLDIRVEIPEGTGVYPILALPEGTRQQTGLILATPDAKIPTFSEKTNAMNPILNYQQDLSLVSLYPMPSRLVQQSLVFVLQGNMRTYRWTINGQAWPYVTPFVIKPNQRIEMVFNNKSGMAHPMHFHGHDFQISDINGKKFVGRQGDTVNVLPYSSVKVIFDSDNPGIWMLHCHILYHQEGGMMTTINYEGYPNKFTTKQREEGEKLYGMTKM